MIRVKFKKRQPLKLKKRLRNKARVRKKVVGSGEIPRLSVFKSGRHIYAQLIDDAKQETLLSANSLKNKEKTQATELAKKIGETIAKKAIDTKIKKVVFDRSGFIYHGRIKALADGARSAGLKF